MLRPALTALLLVPALALGACTDSAAPASTPTAAATSAATSAPTTTATRAATGTATATASGTATAARAKVSANSASIAQLQAAFEAAGISSAARWAREVDEYRAYPADAPDMPKLRKELGKYNPGPGVVDAIIATLSLP